MEADWVRVCSKGSRSTKEVTRSNHRLIADEPVHLAGTNLGLNPYEWLLVALGKGTGMTIQMVVRRNK